MTDDVPGGIEKRPAAGAIAGADVLEGNAMGIVYGDGTTEDKLGRLVALVPMALEVVDEARATIARLREANERMRAENARLREENERLRGENDRMRAENDRLTATLEGEQA